MTWTELLSLNYWRRREWVLVGNGEAIEERVKQLTESRERRSRMLEVVKQEFLNKEQGRQLHENSVSYIPQNDINNLTFWIIHLCYKYCETCKNILPLRLLPNFSQRKKLTQTSQCPCKKTNILFQNRVKSLLS